MPRRSVTLVRQEHKEKYEIERKNADDAKAELSRATEQVARLRKASKACDRRMKLAKNLVDMEIPADVRIDQLYDADRTDQLEWRVSWEDVCFVMDLRMNHRGDLSKRYPFVCPVTSVERETPEFRKRLTALCEQWCPAITPASVIMTLYAREMK
jgi:hypothetical protein